MSVTLTKLKNNNFTYQTISHTDNSLVGFDGTLTSNDCYLSNNHIHDGMTLAYEEYDSNVTWIKITYPAVPYNSLIELRGYDSKSGTGPGNPLNHYSDFIRFIPANTEFTDTWRQPYSKYPFIVQRIII